MNNAKMAFWAILIEEHSLSLVQTVLRLEGADVDDIFDTADRDVKEQPKVLTRDVLSVVLQQAGAPQEALDVGPVNDPRLHAGASDEWSC